MPSKRHGIGLRGILETWLPLQRLGVRRLAREPHEDVAQPAMRRIVVVGGVPQHRNRDLLQVDRRRTDGLVARPATQPTTAKRRPPLFLATLMTKNNNNDDTPAAISRWSGPLLAGATALLLSACAGLTPPDGGDPALPSSAEHAAAPDTPRRAEPQAAAAVDRTPDAGAVSADLIGQPGERSWVLGVHAVVAAIVVVQRIV